MVYLLKKSFPNLYYQGVLDLIQCTYLYYVKLYYEDLNKKETLLRPSYT